MGRFWKIQRGGGPYEKSLSWVGYGYFLELHIVAAMCSWCHDTIVLYKAANRCQGVSPGYGAFSLDVTGVMLVYQNNTFF